MRRWQTRIAVHRADRPAGWRTLEAPSLLGAPIAEAAAGRAHGLAGLSDPPGQQCPLGAGDEAPAAVAEAAVAREVAPCWRPTGPATPAGSS